MPTKHKAIRAEPQVPVNVLTSSIGAYVDTHSSKILFTLMPAGFEFKPEDELDGCGPTTVLKELERVLFISIMRVRAVPYRAPRKMIAVLEDIASDPDITVKDFSVLDPEAIALFENEYVKLSPRCRRVLLEFHAGTKSQLDRTSAIEAARSAVKFLQAQIRRGQPKNLPQQKLALDLGKLYLRYNPTIGRRVRGEGEFGRFKRFVQTVLPLYNEHAKSVGRVATADS